MKIRSTVNRAVWVSTVVAGLIAVNLLWNSASVRALGEVEGRVGFGLISLAPGQQARLNLMSMLAQEPDGPDRPVRTVTLAFDVYAPETSSEDSPVFTTEGRSRVVSHRFVQRQSVEVTLRAGQAASFEFLATEHTLISAVVIDDPNIRTIEDPNIRLRRGAGLRATLEVREDGRSSFVLSPAAVLFGEVDGYR